MALITDLKRNDAKAALALALERHAAGQLTGDVVEQLAMLQDDSFGFLDALADAIEEDKSSKSKPAK